MTPAMPIPLSDVPISVLATGFGFVEAPSFDRAGTLFFSEVRAGTVHRLPVGGRAAAAGAPPKESAGVSTSVFHRVASGWCNGTAFHADGRLFLCDVGAGCIWAISPEGQATLFADRCTDDGARLRGPNDLVFDRHGTLYFTDPRGSTLDAPHGAIYRAHGDGRVERIGAGYAFPNGLALTPDERALIVAETRTRRLHRVPLSASGAAGKPDVYCQLPEDGAGPDGMAMAADGTLYVCHIGAGVIDVVSPAGRVTERIPAGGNRPSNCAFHERALYVTVTHDDAGALHRLDVGVEGHPLYGSAPPPATTPV